MMRDELFHGFTRHEVEAVLAKAHGELLRQICLGDHESADAVEFLQAFDIVRLEFAAWSNDQMRSRLRVCRERLEERDDLAGLREVARLEEFIA